MKPRKHPKLRLFLTLLLFALLGLTTSIAIAWGVTIQALATRTVDDSFWALAINQDRAFLRIPAQAAADQDDESKLHWAWFPRQKIPAWSEMKSTPKSVPSFMVETAAGWPSLCLMHKGTGQWREDRGLALLPQGALMGKLRLSSIDPKYHDITRLPLQPIWGNLLLNTAFWALMWFALMSLPLVWRLNLWLRWRPQNRCVWCGYDLSHSQGRCPECGKESAFRPRVLKMPGLILPAVLVVLSLPSIAGFAWYFAQQHEYDPIHWAAHGGDLEAVRHELELGVDVDLRTRDGNAARSTPLLLAASKNHEEIVKLLLESGADVTLGMQKNEAISYAVDHGNVQMFDQLLEAGATVNYTSSPLSSTPLMVAVINGHEEMVRRLLQEGVDVNAMTMYGQNAIHVAASFGNYEILTILLEAGADPHWPEGSRIRGPLAYAAMSGPLSILQRLLEEDLEIRYQDLSAAIERSQYDALKMLVEHGGDVTERGTLGQTLLFEAAGVLNSNERIWKFLVDHGIELNARNTIGHTALFTAAEMGRPKLVKFLLDHGADPTIKAESGHTAFDLALDDESRAMLEEAMSSGDMP